jgi:hypothetical protein
MKQLQKTRNTQMRPRRTEAGHKINVPSLPPDFTAIPWYPIVLRLENPGTAVTTLNVENVLATQLGLTFPSGTVDIRLISVRVWGPLTTPTGTSALKPLNMAVLDPIGSGGTATTGGTGTRTMEVITDYPDQVQRPAVGYKYSISNSQTSLRCVGTGSGVTLWNLQGAGTGSIMYINILWRSPNVLVIGNAVPALSPSFEDD